MFPHLKVRSLSPVSNCEAACEGQSPAEAGRKMSPSVPAEWGGAREAGGVTLELCHGDGSCVSGGDSAGVGVPEVGRSGRTKVG